MSSLAPDDTPMLSDAALPPADALPQAAAAAAGAPNACAPVGPRAAMVALPQSAAALPTHMLAAWSSPSSASSSAASSAASSASSSSSALLRAYAAATARQLSSPSSSASSSAASSASTSPAGSRRASFAEDDWRLAQAERNSFSFDTASVSSSAASTPPSTPKLTPREKKRAVSEVLETPTVKKPRKVALTAHVKNLNRVAAGHRSNHIGNEEEDCIKAALEAHPAVATVVKPAHNDKATDLNVRLKYMDLIDFRMVQVKASDANHRRYLLPADYLKPEYARLVVLVHLRGVGEIYVDYGGCFVEPSVRERADARAKANKDRCIRYDPNDEDERDKARATAADWIVTLLEHGQRFDGPNATPKVLVECIGLKNAAKLLAGEINLTWQPSSAGGHSTHDATVSGTLVQVKTRSGGQADYRIGITHLVNGENRQPYPQGMAFIFNFTDWPDSMYYLSAEQATAEHFTGPGDLIKQVHLFHPRHIPADDPMAKYLWPRPGSAETAAAAASSAGPALPDNKAELMQLYEAIKQKLVAMVANDKQETSK